MGMSEDEQTIQRLEQERASVESQAHTGFADAARFRRLDYEIQSAEEQLAQDKQRAEQGEG